MRQQRKTIVIGLAGAATAAALAVGATAAVAATSPSPAPNAHWASGQHMAGMGTGAGHGMGAGLGMTGTGSMHTAIATYLGLTEEELTRQMTAGRSLAEVAEAQGKTVEGLTQVMVDQMSTRLDAITGLTAEQKAQRLEWMTANLQRMITTPHSPGSHMGSGGMGMGAGMGGRAGAGTWS